jgi:hypothetical protein
VSKYSPFGFTELSGDEKSVRKPDPPRATQLAAARASDRESPWEWAQRQIRRYVELYAAPSPESSPPVETVSRRREVKPTERGLQYDERIGWHIPCSLSREELASTVPSPETLRRMRAARDKHEDETRQQAERDRLRTICGSRLP